ncbi:metal ABC transporter solute-binding protein, Zn/Mn family [Georgenia satyanarayanai]|uniref:metal ABC transporter solute-binding protein, Zn/Mn family n=1 Tax=Georgenia satyanarayanai TaxID=860221 RepID=UPI001265734F|nr:zinc ABC transporter substrate-binding protein [Georgenia satyanarayanai]
MSSGARNRVLVTAGLVLLAACAGPAGGAHDERVDVTVTTTHAADLLRAVGGAHVEVTALMGPGVDPHLYRASQGDVRALVAADLVVYHGLFLEGRMEEVLEAGALDRVLALTDALPTDALLASTDHPGQHDPHVWFDPELWVRVVDPVVAELSAIAPEHAADFATGGREYVEEALAAHARAAELLAAVPAQRRVLVTSHDAFGYLGRAYGLEVRGVQGLSTEDEAGVADVRRLVDLLVERQVPALFTESSVSPASIEAVQEAAADRGWPVRVPEQGLYSDALGAPGTPTGSYAGVLLANAETIAAALGGP